MKTTVENLDGLTKKVTVELEAKEVDDRINKQYKDFAYRYNFPGFRKGKAPRPVVDNVLGPQAVIGTVTDDILSKVLPVAIDEEGLVPISQVQYEESEALVEPGKPFSFSVTVDTRPEFELDNYKPVAIKVPNTEATEEEIDAQVEELRNYYYDFEDANANTKIKENDFVDLAMHTVNKDGEAVEALTTDSRLYEMGMGLFPAIVDETLIGMKKGDKTTIELDMTQPSMLSQTLSDLGTLTMDLEVKQVKKRIVPELTDEWVKNNAGFDTVKDLRERMAEQIKMQKESMLPRVRENEALYELEKRLKGEAPESMCEAQEAELLQNFFMQLQQSGMSFDMFLAQNGMDPESFKDDLKKQAKDVVNQDLALDAWARNSKIEVTDEELSTEFANSGAEDPKALEKEWREAGRMTVLRQSIAR